jgi:hypothetical protein
MAALLCGTEGSREQNDEGVRRGAVAFPSGRQRNFVKT